MKHISNNLSEHTEKKPYTDKELFEKNRSNKEDARIVFGSIVCFRRPSLSRLQIVGKVVAENENDYIIETSPIKGLCRHSVSKDKVKKYGN